MYWITIIVLLVAINGSLQLSRYDWKKKNVCPKLVGIPACYIVFVFFLCAGISHLFPSKITNTLYFILIGVPALIALAGTISELLGHEICPRTKGGTPMCYISLGMCLVLLTTKYLSLNNLVVWN